MNDALKFIIQRSKKILAMVQVRNQADSMQMQIAHFSEKGYTNIFNGFFFDIAKNQTNVTRVIFLKYTKKNLRMLHYHRHTQHLPKCRKSYLENEIWSYIVAYHGMVNGFRSNSMKQPKLTFDFCDISRTIRHRRRSPRYWLSPADVTIRWPAVFLVYGIRPRSQLYLMMLNRTQKELLALKARRKWPRDCGMQMHFKMHFIHIH